MDSNVIVAHNNVWLKVVPLKVSLFVWWLLVNRILTEANFLRRGIVINNDCRCIRGCDIIEDRTIYKSHAIFLAGYGLWWWQLG